MVTRADRIKLSPYSRHYCHLCDAPKAGLRKLQAGFRLGLEIVDINSDPELERRYGERLPVLAHDGRELCREHLDTATVTAFLFKIR